MGFPDQSRLRFAWRTISIIGLLAFLAVQVWAVMNVGSWIDHGFHRLRTVEGFALWCVATGLTYGVIVFARDKADRLENSHERSRGYPKVLRVAAGFAFVLAGLGLANSGLWHRTFAGMSEKQLLLLAAAPALIVGYYVMAYGNPADH